MKKSTIIITIAITMGVLVIVGGIGVWLTFRSASQMFTEVPRFWEEYESKPQYYYEEFFQACDRILEAYSNYTDYPFCDGTLIKANLFIQN